MLNQRFHPPEIGGLTYKHGSILQIRKPVAVMAAEILVNRFIFIKTKILAADFYRDHLCIA
jgi:hypothetical protein